MRTRRNWSIAGLAAVCLITGVALSHRVEPGVRVQKVTLAENTPALKFIPTGAGDKAGQRLVAVIVPHGENT
jgi:hypothetical protein